jgi:hypothetical protein
MLYLIKVDHLLRNELLQRTEIQVIIDNFHLENLLSNSLKIFRLAESTLAVSEFMKLRGCGSVFFELINRLINIWFI